MDDPCRPIIEAFSPERAVRAQRILSSRVRVEDDFPPIRLVAGLDVAYSKIDNVTVGVGVAVLLSYPSLKLVDCVAYRAPVCVPYIPGLLAFREARVLVPALSRLIHRGGADLVVVDGHGLAHPRRLGIASHIGVVFDIPSIGVAKKRLYGKTLNINGVDYLVDEHGRKLGIVLKYRRGSSIYVSPGHRVSVDTAARLIERMILPGRKLPEPTRLADRYTKILRNNLYDLSEGYIQCPDSSSRSIF